MVKRNWSPLDLKNEHAMTKDEISYWLLLIEILNSSLDDFPSNRIFTLRQLMPPEVWCEAVDDNATTFGHLVKPLALKGLIDLDFIAKNSANHCLYKIIRG